MFKEDCNDTFFIFNGFIVFTVFSLSRLNSGYSLLGIILSPWNAISKRGWALDFKLSLKLKIYSQAAYITPAAELHELST